MIAITYKIGLKKFVLVMNEYWIENIAYIRAIFLVWISQNNIYIYQQQEAHWYPTTSEIYNTSDAYVLINMPRVNDYLEIINYSTFLFLEILNLSIICEFNCQQTFCMINRSFNTNQ